MSIRAIDVGFDLRVVKVPVDLSQDSNISSMPYDDIKGKACVARGDRDEIASELARNGYFVVTAKTPNGREVRCEPKHPAKFIMQPPNDNYWIAYSSTKVALESF